MDNNNFSINDYLNDNSKSIKDYLMLVRVNLKTFLTITLLLIGLTVLYISLAENVYKSTVTLKISRNQNNIFNSSDPYVSADNLDRFVANEIETMESIDTRERVAQSLTYQFNKAVNKNELHLIKASKDSSDNSHKNVDEIIELLEGVVLIEQKTGMDIVEISGFSTSPAEAALIAGIYADEYIKLNLELNRNQLSSIRKFLEEQTSEKLAELIETESMLKNFQERGGIVSLDAQSAALINQMAQLDAQRDAARIDFRTSSDILNQYKNDLRQQDPKLVEYLETQTSQAYIDVLQEQIAELQVRRDIALTNLNYDSSSKTIKDFDQKINELNSKLNSKISEIKTTAFATNPEHVLDLSRTLIEEEIRNHSLEIRLNELNSIISGYESNFRKIPKKSIELAQYERKRESLKEVYSLVEKKYQEAMINELSQPGNIVTIGKERIPQLPSKPKRTLILLIGLIFSPAIAFGFILVKDYFDDKIKCPADIEEKNINFLTWIPYVKKMQQNGSLKSTLFSINEMNSPLSESIKVIKSRIQFFKHDSNKQLKVFLITSPAAQEGKTVISLNLAASFAQSNKNTLLIDSDLRKPRVHTLMGINRTPGLTDYLLNQSTFDEIISKSVINNLSFIPAGTLTRNSDELLKSEAMKKFLEKLRDIFDVIVIDSAPIIPVIDTEILSRLVDGTILVVSANKTVSDLMVDSIELIKNNESPFFGTVLNNFKYKNGYGYYHKYYYNYGDSVKPEKIVVKKPAIKRRFK